MRGYDRPASAARTASARAASLNVLHSSRRARRGALLPEGQLLVEVDVVVARQQALGLQLDERGGDEQELGGDVEIEPVHRLELGDVGVDDDRQPQLVEVDLLAEDQVEEEVEGSLEDRRLHLVWHGPRVNHTRVVRVNRLAGRGSGPPPTLGRSMARVFSGIQPTGDLHLGNLLGAVRRWVAEQGTNDEIFCVVDLHALTALPARGAAAQHPAGALLVASGLDPDIVILFVQSHVHQHAELAWVMECTAAFGELRRMTQFKDKSERAEFVSAGLFTYPALMAADILLYDTDEVPVGDDQRQHVELARDLAVRFNSRYGDTLVVPKATSRRSPPG